MIENAEHGQQQVNVTFSGVVAVPTWAANLILAYFLVGSVLAGFVVVGMRAHADEMRRLNTEIRLLQAGVATLASELSRAGALDAGQVAKMSVLWTDRHNKEQDDAQP